MSSDEPESPSAPANALWSHFLDQLSDECADRLSALAAERQQQINRAPTGCDDALKRAVVRLTSSPKMVTVDEDHRTWAHSLVGDCLEEVKPLVANASIAVRRWAIAYLHDADCEHNTLIDQTCRIRYCLEGVGEPWKLPDAIVFCVELHKNARLHAPSLYVATSFLDWRPDGVPLRDTGKRFESEPIELPLGLRIEFKVTRGTWSTVEVNADGSELPNRHYEVEPQKPGYRNLVTARVAGWIDSPPPPPPGPVGPPINSATERRCPYCHRGTPKYRAICYTCGSRLP
jgi:hypothetical protein